MFDCWFDSDEGEGEGEGETEEGEITEGEGPKTAATRRWPIADPTPNPSPSFTICPKDVLGWIGVVCEEIFAVG